jgi:hypothetical protein
VKTFSPRTFWLIGFLLVLTGVILPFLMVLHLIPSTFFINFFSFGATILGSFMGIIGTALNIKARHKREKGQQ